jgi:voltage-gated potassium channel
MSDNATVEAELGNTGYELFVGALSILSLVNIVLVSLLRDRATQTVVYLVDSIVSAVFLVDFLVRLRRAPARSDYFFRQYGWADLAASLPFPQVKVLRIFRLIRVARLLRRYGGRNIARSLIHDRAGSALLTLLFIAVLVLEFGSLAMLYVERSAPEANIKTASGAPVGPWGEVYTKFCAPFATMRALRARRTRWVWYPGSVWAAARMLPTV